MRTKSDTERLNDAQAIIRQKNTELLDAKRTIARLTEESDDAKTVRENIYKIAAYDPDPPEWTVREGRAGARGVPATIWSDWHYGEVVRMPGINTYDKAVARRRIKHLAETTVDLAFNHMGRAKITYPGCIVALGGDMLGGDIHEELMKTNDATTQQQ